MLRFIQPEIFVLIHCLCIHNAFSCPAQCVCSSTHVSCQSRSPPLLERIPSILPNGTIVLNVQNQNIPRVYREDFSISSSLLSLTLVSNKIYTIDEDAFHNLPNITSLYLDHNLISVLSERTFQTLINLQTLHLNDNVELVMSSCTLSGLPKLDRLQLEDTNVTFSNSLFVSQNCPIQSYQPLVFLSIPYRKTDHWESVSALQNFPTLPTLRIKGELGSEIEDLPQYTQLSAITLNNIISPLKTLKTLTIYESFFTHLPPYAFTNASSVEVLQSEFGNLTYVHRDSIKGLINLRQLWLRGNNIQTLPSGLLVDVTSSFGNLYLWSNPLLCDCGLKLLVEYPLDHGVAAFHGTCETPTSLAGTRLEQLTISDFSQCPLSTTRTSTADETEMTTSYAGFSTGNTVLSTRAVTNGQDLSGIVTKKQSNMSANPLDSIPVLWLVVALVICMVLIFALLVALMSCWIKSSRHERDGQETTQTLHENGRDMVEMDGSQGIAVESDNGVVERHNDVIRESNNNAGMNYYTINNNGGVNHDNQWGVAETEKEYIREIVDVIDSSHYSTIINSDSEVEL